LGQTRRCHSAESKKPGRPAAYHRRYVHLQRRRPPVWTPHAALGPGRWLSRMGKRLQNPPSAQRVKTRDDTRPDQWESLYLAAGSPEKVLLFPVRNPKLKGLRPDPGPGRPTTAVNPQKDTPAISLVIEEAVRVGTVISCCPKKMSANKSVALVSFDSECASSGRGEGPFAESNPHPRAYGNFARLLKYVRTKNVITLRKRAAFTSLAAHTLKLDRRGLLKPDSWDLPSSTGHHPGHATFEQPHQYATGMNMSWSMGVFFFAMAATEPNRPRRARARLDGGGGKAETESGKRKQGSASGSGLPHRSRSPAPRSTRSRKPATSTSNPETLT